ncbi:hypothetical protein CCON61_09120 [Campylobacter concisus]|jgi:hypothetical protein|uniref:hypothetical protein n=1 Tax=Campylobacter concisus TaxID=199 RepID=UPI000A1EC676|nr:hypothetical protein [Campylobacter concisus]OSQ22858.1 hypothetical protein CCON61_09120 [Campylobacter concisus]
MDSLISDLLKIVLGAVLTMCAQWVYANLNTKKEKNKLRRQKLEEAFIIVGDILGGIHYKVALLINPNLNIENPKFEIGKLHSLISFYAPELEEDYKDFMSTYQEFGPLILNKFRTLDSDGKRIEATTEELVQMIFSLSSKGNIIKEKLAKIAQTL